MIWVSDFLHGQIQTVVVDEDLSTRVPVTPDIPQGSVLGPILFLCYISDLPEQVSRYRLLADDTILYRKIKKPEDSKTLQEYLDALEAKEKQ